MTDTTASKTLLKEGVKPSWLFAFLLSSFLTIASFVFINSTQAYILTDLLDIPRSKLGLIQGNLSSVDEGISMVMVIVWGVLSDRIGRRVVFSVGFLLMALATFLYPLASSVYGTADTPAASTVSIFNSLLFYRLIFACGGAATSDMLTVVLGDYAAEGKRSKLAGLLGVSTGLGACFGALFLNRLPTFFTRSQNSSQSGLISSSTGTIYASFWISALLLVGGAFISGFGVRKPPQPKEDPLTAVESADGKTCPVSGDSSLNSSTKCWWKRIVYGFKAIKTHPTLLAAYLGGFVARGDSIILSVFLPPWIASFYARNNLCQVDPSTVAVSDAAMYITKCPEAKRLVSTLTGISNLSALLAAPLVGNFADRLGPLGALAVPAALGACAYGVMLFISDPRSKIVMIMAVLQGFAQIGMIISSVSLVAKEAPPHARGAISGVYSLFGAIGIITVSKIGGALTEMWTETGPFSIIASANIVLLFVLFFLKK
jgi:MFS family permease